MNCSQCPVCTVFLSTLSLRRATALTGSSAYCQRGFLSTLSLRRATVRSRCRGCPAAYFYPRSPCGERPKEAATTANTALFLSTLSLRRATPRSRDNSMGRNISIHALLAESDLQRQIEFERYSDISIHALLAESDPAKHTEPSSMCTFLSTLSLRRATVWPYQRHFASDISIHALLAESDCVTLFTADRALRYFYPRSPCGERHLATS